MADSLQDQLRALGLASKQTDKPKRKKRRPAGKRHGQAKSSGGSSDMSLQQAWSLRARQEKQDREQYRKRKQEEDRKRRELNAKIREIVKPNRLNKSDSELARNFMYKGKIRKIAVNEEQLKALNEGRLGVVYLAGGYHLLEPEWVEKVRVLSPDHVPDLSSGNDGDEEFPVPDDITW